MKTKVVTIITSVIVSVFLVAGFSFASDTVVNTVKKILMSEQEMNQVNEMYDQELQTLGVEVDTTGLTLEDELIAKKRAISESKELLEE